MMSARLFHSSMRRMTACGCLAALLAAGCAAPTRQKLLGLFFDGFTDTAPAPTRRVRRDLLQEIEDLKRQLREARETAAQIQPEASGAAPNAAAAEASSLPIEQARTWEEAAQILPQLDGAADWSQALATGVIAPKPGPEPSAPLQPVMPLDVELTPEDPMYAVVFRHATHTPMLSCANCHADLFQMKRGATPITMDAINEGRYCGACHGKVAFSTDACTRCHQAIGGGS